MREKDSDKRMDDWLRKRYEKYTGWLDRGEIDYTSRVIPVNRSLEGKQWVLPTEQITEILKQTDLIALNQCVCRIHYKRCDNPLDVPGVR